MERGRLVRTSVLGALIGVILDLYAAHILVAIFGKTLLQRDPSGRSVVRGHAAGIGFAIVLNIVWVLAVCGAVAPEVLADPDEHGLWCRWRPRSAHRSRCWARSSSSSAWASA